MNVVSFNEFANADRAEVAKAAYKPKQINGE